MPSPPTKHTQEQMSCFLPWLFNLALSSLAWFLPQGSALGSFFFFLCTLPRLFLAVTHFERLPTAVDSPEPPAPQLLATLIHLPSSVPANYIYSSPSPLQPLPSPRCHHLPYGRLQQPLGRLYFPEMAVTAAPIPYALLGSSHSSIKRWSTILLLLHMGGLLRLSWSTEDNGNDVIRLPSLDHKNTMTFLPPCFPGTLDLVRQPPCCGEAQQLMDRNRSPWSPASPGLPAKSPYQFGRQMNELSWK